MLRETRGNMYEWVTHTWNPIKGICSHDCEYCYMKVYPLGKTRLDPQEFKILLGTNNLIFVGSSCDIFADSIPREWIKEVLKHCRKHSDNGYLFQTKNPKRFHEFIEQFPKGTTLGTTIETNRHYKQMGSAPPTIERANAMHHIKLPKMVTIEPIMDFDTEELVNLIHLSNPKWINIGADSKGHNLPEPSKNKVMELINKINKFCEIRCKSNLQRLLQ